MSNCMNERCRGRCSSRGGGLFRTIFTLALLYATLLFGSGTLIQTEHPVAVEVGRIVRLITFVEPTIGWADAKGYDALAGSLRVVSNGADVS